MYIMYKMYAKYLYCMCIFAIISYFVKNPDGMFYFGMNKCRLTEDA